jgi:DNA polymerase-3 subunit alpha
MAVFTLEDLQDGIEVCVFPRAMVEHGHKLADDAVVLVKGRLDARDDTPKLLCHEVTVVEGLSEAAPPLRIRLPATAVTEERVATLKRLLGEHPGESKVLLDLGAGKVLRLPDDFAVDLGRAVGELRVAFGHDCVTF